MDATAERLEVMVVGAGLSGTLAAMYLARRGHRVEVYERRADPRLSPGDAGRSINLGLSARGMAALREVGLLDTLLETAMPLRGRLVHGIDGALSFHPYGKAEHEVLYSIQRHELNTLLIDAADALDNVTLTFDAKLTALDADNGLAWFVDERAGTEISAKADLVIGADGAFSVVRQHLLHGSRADYQQEFMDWGYKELRIPVGADGQPRAALDVLHIWPRRNGLMLANPNCDGSLTCTLFLPFTGEHSFASLQSPAAVRAFFDSQYPDSSELIPGLLDEFAAHPVGHLINVRTSRWHHKDRVVLIGDACHAVYPFYAQGMNAAFEDCSVLDACLEANPTNRAAALEQYENIRRPNTDVLADLAKQHFLELRDRVRSPWFLAKKKADLLLSRMLPGVWLPMYSMVSHTTMPYTVAVDRAKRQDTLLKLAGGMTAVAAGAASMQLLSGIRSRLPGR
jgi:kynurenine 3-monooxygenase